MAPPDMHVLDDLAAFATLRRADRKAVLRLLSDVERAVLKRRLEQSRVRRAAQSNRASARLAQFSPALRRVLRRAVTGVAHDAGITPATQQALRELLSPPESNAGGAA